MKTAFRILFASVFFLPLACFAQEGGSTVKVTTRLLPDGSKSVIKTDLEQHTMETTTYDDADKLKQRVIYILDARDQPMSAIVYTPSGQPVYKCAYKYDDVGRTKEEANYTLDGQLLRRFVYEYGSDGKTFRVRAFDANGNELRQAGGGAAANIGSTPQVKKDKPKRAPFRNR